MEKAIFIIGCLFRFGLVLGMPTESFHGHVIVSPHAASEVFLAGGEKHFVAPSPAQEVAAVAAPSAPITAIASAPQLAFAAPVTQVSSVVPAPQLAFAAPATPVAAAAATPLAVAPVPQPVVAKVAQFKLSYPQYAYGYSVQDFTTGDNKVAKEVREGGVVKGSYSVADPDGTKRTVNYYADPVHGFNAVVHKTQIL